MGVNTYAMAHVDQKSRLNAPFYLLMFYLFVEYARPSFIAVIRPALVLQFALLYYLLSYKKDVIRIFQEKYFKTYMILLFLMLVHVFFATNNYWAFVHFQTMVSYLIISVSICLFLDSVYKLERFASFFVLVLSLCAVSRIAGSDLIGGAGHLGDENDFALAMNVALPISFFLGRSASGWRKLFFTFASVLFVLGCIVSQSRGGFIGLAAVGAVCWLHSRHKFKALLVVFLLGALAWGFAAPEFKEEIAGIGIESAESDTGKDRIELWKVAWRAFLDNPALGVGQGNMPVVMEKYQYDSNGESHWQRGLWGRAIHSVFFTLLPELGIAGVILMGMMFKDLLQKSRKTKEHCISENSDQLADRIEYLSISLLAGVFGYLVTGIFVSAFYYPQFWNLAAMLVGLYLVVSRTAVEPSFSLEVKAYRERWNANGV